MIINKRNLSQNQFLFVNYPLFKTKPYPKIIKGYYLKAIHHVEIY